MSIFSFCWAFGHTWRDEGRYLECFCGAIKKL